MDFYFYIISNDDYTGGKLGWADALANKDKWIQCNEVKEYLAAGYVNGVDHVVYENKAAYIKKTYINLEEKYVVHVCALSKAGCDIVVEKKEEPPVEDTTEVQEENTEETK